MTLDPEVLAEVLAARDRVDELEDAAWGARAQFHQAIRRLHLAGGSLREIATELAMSHQRVHQIVGEDAIVEVETTASEVVARRETAVEDTCTFCGAPRREVDRMLTGPGGTYICGSCVTRASQTMHSGMAIAVGATGQIIRRGGAAPGPCTFCRNDAATVGPMIERSDSAVRMCRNCLEACERMLAPAGVHTPKGPAMKRRAIARCSFCNVSQKDCKKLIAGPGVYVCETCISAAAAVVAGAPSVPSRAVVIKPNQGNCAFCGKLNAMVTAVAGAGRGRICNECLDLCHDILVAEV